jgi:hypothetical protein
MIGLAQAFAAAVVSISAALSSIAWSIPGEW